MSVYLVIFSSSVVRRCTSHNIISGTMVYVIVSGTTVYLFFYLQWNVGSSPSVECRCILLYFHRQWYVDVHLIISSVERWYMLSSVVRRYISFSTSSGTLVAHL